MSASTGRPNATGRNEAFNLDRAHYYDRSNQVQPGGSLDHKLLFSEWNWHGNRRPDAPNIQWHNPGGSTRQMNTQFADGHAEFYSFSTYYESVRGRTGRSPELDKDDLW